MEGRKVYRIPKYVDDDPKVFGIIPLDTVVIFVGLSIPLIWILGTIKGTLLSIGGAFAYYRYVKRKGRGYYKLLAFKLGIHLPSGTLPPTEKEVRA